MGATMSEPVDDLPDAPRWAVPFDAVAVFVSPSNNELTEVGMVKLDSLRAENERLRAERDKFRGALTEAQRFVNACEYDDADELAYQQSVNEVIARALLDGHTEGGES